MNSISKIALNNTVYDIEDKEARNSYRPNLLEFKWSDHLLNDVQWLRADTFSWQSSAVYQAAYQHLVDDLPEASYGIVLQNDGTYYRYADGDVTGDRNPYCWSNGTSVYFTRQEIPTAGNYVYQSSYATQTEDTIISVGNVLPTPETETIAGTTISFYTAADGHKICLEDQENNVESIYSATGVAWYFILDTANERFKLPRINPARKELLQTIGVRGNGKTLGLTDGTNIGGLFSTSNNTTSFTSNYGDDVGSSWSGTTYSSNKTIGVTTDSSKSGIIADLSSTTSIYAGQKYLYFYVGDYTQTAIEQTAGLNAELFNGKLDLDLGNIPNTSKETIVSWGMPDYSSGVSVSSPFTPTKDGILIVVYNITAYLGSVTIKKSSEILNAFKNVTSGSGGMVALTATVSKNEEYTFDTGSLNSAVFYPLKGVPNA